ncbi:S41 family peptidase [Flavobacterium sp. DG1-102-2]|uniref:S41 family peptidase n=1 Tax=Flavobacterium sp. DG1-102-2 TaxID=3081663 RepID=UPI00294A90EF|nr:S41 family peptidase [Flavobacterium sp. DG1-102-2]MDV6167941.1 S41 family peptidase [Flavobacterium sp. DG1-102-2]
MKATITCIALLLLQAVTAQTLTETQKLEATARIWGFLKYYHPQVAAGKYNWDDKLIELLPVVEQVKDKQELSKVYLNWIDGLGKVPVCKKCAKQKGERFEKNFSMAWMENDAVFTPELTAKLKYIEANRKQGKQHYVKNGGAGQIAVNNEPEYKDFAYPSEGYRMLTLFRYWNLIEYFFPYKYQTDKKWGDVLTEMIPKYKNAQDALEYQLAITETVADINDTHAQINPPHVTKHYGYYWAPFKFKLIDDKAVITGFYNKELADKDGIAIGDVITHVDGIDIKNIFQKNYKYLSASNEATKKRGAYYSIFNGSSTKAKITLEKNGTVSQKEINRYYYRDLKYKWGDDSNKTLYKVLDGNIGYVNMGALKHKDVNAMYDSLKHCKSLILDIRNYPNGTMYHVARNIMSERKPFVKFTQPDFNYPGKFIWTDDFKIGMKNNKNAFKGKIVVLVNEETQSHAEFTAMGMQVADNVTVVGSQTAGADGNITNFFDFPGGFKTCFTGLGVFYPDGRETQRIGIVPNVEIHPTIAGIQAGRDEVLDKAIEIAKQ